MITILRPRVTRTNWSLPWRSRSQHDLASKSCPAHNFVIWSQILKLFHRIDHHIETTCGAQHLGHYLEGQGHSMTLHQNRVRPITLFLKSDFKLFHRNDHHIKTTCRAPIGLLPWRSRSHHDLALKSCPANNFVIWNRISKLFHRNCRAQHLGSYLEGQGHSLTLQQDRVRSITLLFDVGFYNYFWQTTSLCPIPIRGALPGSDRLLFLLILLNKSTMYMLNYQSKNLHRKIKLMKD